MRHTEMPIGLLTLEIHILDAQSLKDKRQVLRSLKDRLRAHYNVAVAELEHQETWQRSRVGVVTISGDSGYLEKTLAEIAADLVLPGQMHSVGRLLAELDDPGEVSRLGVPLFES